MRNYIGYKLLLALLILMVVIFYDTTFPLINTLIQLKINILGFFLEPTLQWAFKISLRQAQIISAWIYLFLASLLFWYLLKIIYLVFVSIYYSARQLWRELSEWQKIGLIVLIIVLFLAIGKAILFFF